MAVTGKGTEAAAGCFGDRCSGWMNKCGISCDQLSTIAAVTFLALGTIAALVCAGVITITPEVALYASIVCLGCAAIIAAVKLASYISNRAPAAPAA